MVVDTWLTPATGTAEREAVLAMAEGLPGQHRGTLGGDRNDATQACVRDWRALQVTPHVAQPTTWRTSATEARRLDTQGPLSVSANGIRGQRSAAG